MQYWNEMNTKYGFADGESYPAGIEIYRDVYVKAVSRLAEHFGSDYRVVPYDRCGVHNFCLWYFTTKEWFENVYLPRQEPSKKWVAVDNTEVTAGEKIFFDDTDDAMYKAIELALDLDIDRYVEVQTSVAPSFGEFLENVSTGNIF